MNFQELRNKSNLAPEMKSAIDFMSQKMPSVNINHPNPIETLSLSDLEYLSKYIQHIIKNRLLHANIKPTQTQYVAKGPFQDGNNHNQQQFHTNNNRPQFQFRDNTRPFVDNNTRPFVDNNAGPFLDNSVNRVNELYDPLGRAVPVDWRTYQNSRHVETPIIADNEPGYRSSASTRFGKKSYHNPYECGAPQDVGPSLMHEPYHGPYSIDPIIMDKMGASGDLFANVNDDHIRNVGMESLLLQKETTHLPGQKKITENEINRFENLRYNPQDHRHLIWADDMPRGGYATRNERVEYADEPKMFNR